MLNDQVHLATETQTSNGTQLTVISPPIEQPSTDVPRGQLVEYKPGFQWVKFRLRYRQVAESSPEITQVVQAYLTYQLIKLQSQRQGKVA